MVNHDIEDLKLHVPLQLVDVAKGLLGSRIRDELQEPGFAGKSPSNAHTCATR